MAESLPRIFISYRRSDAKWATGRLYDRLAAVVGTGNVFLDVSNIEPGKDFIAEIEDVVGACDVVLAVMGKEWLGAATESGQRRIDNPRDLVRIELTTALKRNIRVIPILIDGASLPDEEILPEDLAPLARRNARQVSFEGFHSDMDSFIRVMQRILEGPIASPKTAETPASERVEQRPAGAAASKLPFTVSLETLGGVSTPLIRMGSALPAEATEVFSTATDNQTTVEIKLFAGERAQASENVALGTFQLGEIAQQPRGVPQIRVRTLVDPSMVLVVTAEDLQTGRKTVLDAVDLMTVTLPPLALVSDLPAPGPAPMKSFSEFADILGDFFGMNAKKKEAPVALDCEIDLALSRSEAESGAEKAVDGPNGKIVVRVPQGVKTGSRLRIKGNGRRSGDRSGDLYLKIVVQE